MNIYWAGGLLLAFVLWSGFMYHEGTTSESHVCGEADAKHDLAESGQTVAAQGNVIKDIGKQQTVTQGASNAYENTKDDINNQYVNHVDGLQSTPVAENQRANPIPNAASRPNAPTCKPQRSKYYRLNGQECDDNTAQLIGLQEWVAGQQKISLEK